MKEEEARSSPHTVRVKDRWIFRDKTEWRANLFPRVRANTRVPSQRGVRALEDSAEGTFVNREQHEPHQSPSTPSGNFPFTKRAEEKGREDGKRRNERKGWKFVSDA